MRTVTASEANRHFSSLLREVAAGETVIVTSHGRAVVTMSPAEPAQAARSEEERARRRQAWDELAAELQHRPILNLGRIDRDALYERDE